MRWAGLLSLAVHGIAVALVLGAPAAPDRTQPLPVRVLLEGGRAMGDPAAPAAPVVRPPLPPAPPPTRAAAAARAPRPRPAPRPAATAPAVAVSEAGVVGPPSGEAASAPPVEVAAATPPGAGAGGRRLFSEAELDGLAAPAERVRPRYPERARFLGRESDVKLAVTVEADGALSDVTVVRSGGDEFDREALAAIRRERWLPARRAGEPVAAVVTFTVRFRLED